MADYPGTKLSAQDHRTRFLGLAERKILLVGRDQEMKGLNALLRDCARGAGIVAVIRGPVASGKTSLLQAFAAHAAAADAVFLGASASRAERGLPLGVLDQLWPGRSLSTAIVPQVAGPLEGQPRVASPRVPGTVSPALVHLFQELLDFVTELSRDRPVVVAVDDMHHADVASLQGLSYLARRAATARVLMVLTEGTHTLPVDRGLHAEILRQGPCHCFPLAPLPPSSVAGLLAEHIDAEAAHRLAPACHALTGGSPLLVSALGDDSRTLPGRRATGLVPRTAFRSAVVTCLHRFEPELVELGQAVAVLDENATPAMLGELLAISPESAARGLDALSASGLLDSGRFRHEQARQAVLGHMTADERRAMHGSAARTLYRAGAAAATLARQLAAAHRVGTRWAVAALADAAEQAVADGEVKRAIDYLRRAECDCADDQQRAAIIFALVRAEWPIDPACAARHLPELAANARAGLLDSKFLGELTHYLLWMGDMRSAVEILVALEFKSAELAPGPARAIDHTTTRFPLDFLYPAALRQARSGVQDDGEAVVATAESILAERGTADPTLASITTALLLLICEDMLDRAAWWCAALLRESGAASGTPLANAVLTAILAMIETRRGNLSAAEVQARKALGLLTRKAWGVAIGAPLSSLLLSTTASRNYEDAAACLRTPVPEAMFGTFYGLLYLYARGEYYLATGRPQTALDDFSECGNRMASWRLDLPGLVPWRTKAAAARMAMSNFTELSQAQLALSEHGRGQDRAIYRCST